MGRINLKRFVKACKNSGGIITVIATRLQVTRQTVYDFIKNEPATQKYLYDAREEVIDMAEGKLLASINSGEIESAKWFLARKGRHRGYIANPEVQVIGKQTNNTLNVEPTYKLVIEIADNVRNKVETEPEAISGV